MQHYIIKFEIEKQDKRFCTENDGKLKGKGKNDSL